MYKNSDSKRPSSKPSWKKDGPSDRQVTMHKAVCDECKRNCEVPFKPTGNKPVLCGDCFGEKKNQNEPRGFKNSRSNAAPPHMGPSRDEKILGSIQSELKSLRLQIDSINRGIQSIKEFVDSQKDQTSLNDVMKEVGVIEEDKEEKLEE